MRATIPVLLAVLAGCASAHSAAPELQAIALTFTPSPGTARIYAFRPGRIFGSAVRLRVAIDSQIVGWVTNGTYLMVELPPGPHRVSAPTPENEASVLVEAMSDSTYFFKVWPKMGGFSAHSGLEGMDPAEARMQIARARIVVSAWPGTPMNVSH